MACTPENKALVLDRLNNINLAYSADIDILTGYYPQPGHDMQFMADTSDINNPVFKFSIPGRTEVVTITPAQLFYFLNNVMSFINDGTILKAIECIEANQTTPPPEPTPDPECYACNTDLVNKLRTLLNDVRFVLKA